jgi:molybdenum cofactor synthesis domain-containing protein
VRAALLTISTSKAAGEGVDESGARLAELAERLGVEIVGREVIPDDRVAIEGRLRHWADVERCALVLTTGGTGLAPSDVTPEATRAVLDRDAPGIAESIRAASRDHTPHWMLSRGVAGVRCATLIVNLPGSPRSILEVAETLELALPHALELIAGGHAGHGAPDARRQ